MLRLRNYTIGRKLDDSEVHGLPGFQRIAGLISCLVPFVSVLNCWLRDSPRDQAILGICSGVPWEDSSVRYMTRREQGYFALVREHPSRGVVEL